MACGVELGLGGAQGGGEGCRALAVVPGAVIAADGVVMGDRAAGLDQRLGGRRLDLVPLLDLAAADRRRHHREVGGRPVRVDVGEAAADPRRARPLGGGVADLGDLGPCRLHRGGVEVLEAVPGDRASRRCRRGRRRRRRCRAGRAPAGTRSARRRPRRRRPPRRRGPPRPRRRVRQRSRSRSSSGPRPGGGGTRSRGRAGSSRRCRRRSCPPRARRAGGSWRG